MSVELLECERRFSAAGRPERQSVDERSDVIDARLVTEVQRSADALRTARAEADPRKSHFVATVESDGSKLSSPAAEWFGMHALRNAYRGVFLSVNTLVAAQLLHTRRLWAPAITEAYSTAYHALESFLAQLGLVIIQTRDYTNGLLKPGPQYVAKFTKKGEWVFERLKLSHRWRWRLLTPYVASSVSKPGFLVDLFDYLFLGESKHRPPWSEVRTAILEGRSAPKAMPWLLEEKAAEFLDRISAVRHDAVYIGAGADPHVTEALMNRDASSDRDIDRQSAAFLSFATGLLTECAERTESLSGCIELDSAIRPWLFLAVDFPWFDELELDQLRDQELANRIRRLREGLMRD